MDFITSSILGGIVYDSLKFGAYKFGGTLREKLRNFTITSEELSIIEDLVELNSLNKDSTIEKINSILDSSKEIKQMLEKTNSSLAQINHITNNYGSIVGQNSGEIKINNKE